MSFSFAQYGAPTKSVEELAQENEANSGGLMPEQKNNLFVIEKAEIQTAASGAVGVNFQFSCVGEKYANRKVFNYVNIVDKQGQLNKVGHSQIGALAFAVGFQGNLDDPEELMQYGGTPFCADVQIEKGQNGYEDRNKLANWKENKGQPFSEKATPKPATSGFNPQSNQAPQQPAQQASFQPQQPAPQPSNTQGMPSFARK